MKKLEADETGDAGEETSEEMQELKNPVTPEEKALFTVKDRDEEEHGPRSVLVDFSGDLVRFSLDIKSTRKGT